MVLLKALSAIITCMILAAQHHAENLFLIRRPAHQSLPLVRLSRREFTDDHNTLGELKPNK